jgi:hypothetical protein
MKIIYKEWYEKNEYGILKHEDPLFNFYSNGVLHMTLRQYYTKIGLCTKLSNKT